MSLIVVAFLVLGLGQASAGALWPSRSKPLSSTQGWFKAINAHNRKHLLFYVAPREREHMGWAEPSHAWPKFTVLKCREIKLRATTAHVRCTFKESGAPGVVGNRDGFWDVYLRRTRGAWLIDGYGQG